MYAVIFKAKVGQQNDEYLKTVGIMRELAFEKYGCLDFIAVTEGEQEIAISYWDNMEAIREWKNDPEHTLAQRKGQEAWYQSYTVQVVEIKREYAFER